jgi:hypothetical protein
MRHEFASRCALLALAGLVGCASAPGASAPQRSGVANADPANTATAACDEPATNRTTHRATDDAARFLHAIEDAAVATADEVRPLVAITDDNAQIIWRDPSHRQLKVVAWMARDIADRFYSPVGKRGTAPPPDGPLIWLSAAPEAQIACRRWGLTGPALRLRMAQLIGLAPTTNNDTLVEMWVDRDAIVRPCVDPDPTDDRCEVQSQQLATGVPGIPDYARFTLRLYRDAYRANGAPWTRLGYTYDWAPNTDEYGVSEFLLAPGHGYEVVAITPLGDYCRAE